MTLELASLRRKSLGDEMR